MNDQTLVYTFQILTILAVSAFLVALIRWTGQQTRRNEEKQRPLSEFPNLENDCVVFPEEVEKIKRRGILSYQKYDQLIKRQLAAINAEIRRRKQEGER